MAVASPSPALPAAAVYPPRITANRRHIDDRFPSLAFTVDTGGHPFFEVLLTTDSSLFNPANAGRRSAANFYSSRMDGGLTPARQAAHPFLVPSATLRAFGSALPRPTAIYYTAIAYADRDGASPAFAVDPSRLALEAPSVAIAKDFTGNTLATVLAISVDKLKRHVEADGTHMLTPSEDAAEGEDGYGQPPPAQAAVAPVPTPAAAPAPAPVAPPASRPQAVPEGDFELAVLPAQAQPALPKKNGAPRDPVLPGHEVTPVAKPAAAPMSTAQGEDYADGEGETPEYLADDDDNESYSAQALAQLENHPASYQSLDAAPAAPAAPASDRDLTVDDKMRIIDHVAPFESGGDYGAINADGEFSGKFGTDHPAYQRYHVGLSYGLIQFTQDSGKLGELLVAMRDRDGDSFRTTFGADADELVRVTTATGPPSSESPGGRSARVQPVAGADLWQEPWVSRFRAAAQNEKFKAAQREVAARGYLDPMLQFAGWLGLNSETALTMVVDRAIQMGVNGAKRWIVSAVGPIGSDALRQQALAAAGFSDVRSFQAATPGLTADGEWGPNTHAALVAALRHLGPSSPVPIPSTEQMVEAMARRAASEPWHARVETLKGANLPDVRYRF